MTESTALRTVLVPAADVATTVAFYRDALGLAVKFADGDRYVALDGGGVTLAVVGAEEDVTAGEVAPSFKTTDVAAAVAAAVAAGGAEVTPVTEGPHELRAVVRDPAGHAIVLYSSR